MATPIRMPDFGTNVEEVKLVAWLKQVGEKVARGEGLCEVETDKATVELESIADGVLLAQVAPAGADLQEGALIAYVGQPGEQVDVCTTGETPVISPGDSSTRTGEAPVVQERQVKAAPMIRNLAQREGVDLARVQGTGPGGQITREDVMRAKNVAQPPPAVQSSPTRFLSTNQRAIARRVSQSHREIVPINLVGRIDMTAAIALRRKLQEQGGKVSFDAIFLYALSRVLPKFPQFSLRIAGEEIAAVQGIHLGFAVSVGGDLYTPTVFDADKKALQEIDAQVRALSDKARTGKLTPEEMSGAIFTISNLGMLPVLAFSAVIPPGQAAALAVGAIEQAPVLQGDTFVPRPQVTVTLSVDHRLINGRQGGEFLAAVKEYVESL